MVDHQSQATPSRTKALRDLGLKLSRLRAHQYPHEDDFNLSKSCGAYDATSTQRFPCTRTSNTTFATFRADAGEAGSLDYSPGEIGELPSSDIPPLTSPSTVAAELECLLGNADGKLKIGATVDRPYHRDLFPPLGTDGPNTRPDNPTTLERAKVRPRVELDIQLAGDTFVQGQCISGHLVVNARGHGRVGPAVLLANNTLRVIGFEYLTDTSPNFHVFFHFSRRFDELCYASEQIFSESPEYSDEEGYREAREGVHVLPFEMELPMDPCFGKPKGVTGVPGGVAMCYIIMASIDIKDPDTNRLSLAHFYRQCTIWPALSLQELLVPSTRPLVSTAVLSVPQGGSYGKLRLAARVPRPSYFTGQSCYVHIQIANNTQRTVHSLCITLVRTTTIYRPRSGRRNHGGKTDEHVTNKYMVKTVIDEISKSRLVMADRTTRRAASSRGWWTGVNPGEKTGFTHCILVPPDALSVARSKLLAVDHAIRVTVYASAGMLGLTTHLSVTLPIRIVSMLSVDPPTSITSPGDMIGATQNCDDGPRSGGPHLHHSELEIRRDSPPTYRTRPSSLEQRQNTVEPLPCYSNTPCRQSAASIVDPAIGDESPVHEDEMSLEVDALSSRLITAHSHRLPAYAVGARSTGAAQEERQFQNGSVFAIRSSEYKETTSPDLQTGGSCMFESSVNDGARESDPNQESNTLNSGSPIPSLHRARERGVTVGRGSEFLRREQTQTEQWQRRSRNPRYRTYGDAKNGEGNDFRSYESPFTQRVREKLRRVHGPREPNQETAELRTSIEGPTSRERRVLLEEGLERIEHGYTRTTGRALVPGSAEGLLELGNGSGCL